MRGIVTFVGLLAVLAIVAVLAKKQFAAVQPPAGGPPAAATAAGVPAMPTGAPQQQLQQVQKAIDAAATQPRPMPEEGK